MGMWTVLEVVLLGALLMYASVSIRFNLHFYNACFFHKLKKPAPCVFRGEMYVGALEVYLFKSHHFNLIRS